MSLNSLPKPLINAALSAGLLVAAGALFLGSVEVAVRAGALPQGSVPWYTPEAIELNQQFEAANEAFGATHPLNFTAPVNSIVPAPHIRRRIAVLGDSFVWGSGLAFGGAWPHKLAAQVREIDPGTEVLSWGISGWSTKDQLEFLKTAAKDYALFHADTVLIAYVTNDPDIEERPSKFLPLDGPVSRFTAALFPNAHAYLTAHIAAFYERFIDNEYGYGNWEEDLYSEENLKRYEGVLAKLKEFADAQDVNIAFIFTPHIPAFAPFEKKYAAITERLDHAGIPYVNPLQDIVAAFGDRDDAPLYPSLWANPGNGHPGPELSSAYVDAAVQLIKDKGWLAPEGEAVLQAQSPPVTCSDETLAGRIHRRTPYDYLGVKYVRLQGVLDIGAVDSPLLATSGRLIANDQQIPIFYSSSGVVDLPRGRHIAYPEHSFWVDAPASTLKNRARIEFNTDIGCTAWTFDAPA